MRGPGHPHKQTRCVYASSAPLNAPLAAFTWPPGAPPASDAPLPKPMAAGRPEPSRPHSPQRPPPLQLQPVCSVSSEFITDSCANPGTLRAKGPAKTRISHNGAPCPLVRGRRPAHKSPKCESPRHAAEKATVENVCDWTAGSLTLLPGSVHMLDTARLEIRKPVAKQVRWSA